MGGARGAGGGDLDRVGERRERDGIRWGWGEREWEESGGCGTAKGGGPGALVNLKGGLSALAWLHHASLRRPLDTPPLARPC